MQPTRWVGPNCLAVLPPGAVAVSLSASIVKSCVSLNPINLTLQSYPRCLICGGLIPVAVAQNEKLRIYYKHFETFHRVSSLFLAEPHLSPLCRVAGLALKRAGSAALCLSLGELCGVGRLCLLLRIPPGAGRLALGLSLCVSRRSRLWRVEESWAFNVLASVF